MNPSIDKSGLSLSIDLTSNALDVGLVRDVGVYFDLDKKMMDFIQSKVASEVSKWKDVAKSIGISRREIELMSPAFNV